QQREGYGHDSGGRHSGPTGPAYHRRPRPPPPPPPPPPLPPPPGPTSRGTTPGAAPPPDPQPPAAPRAPAHAPPTTGPPPSPRPAEIERSLTEAARVIGRDLRVPGFRRGKIPPPVVIRRVGRETLLDETVKERISSWYTAAIGEAGIAPIGQPDISLGDLPAAG